MKITLVTIEEAAQAVGVSTKTLIRWEQQGYIAPIKIKNKIRYYGFENIAQLIDLKRQPYSYFLQMSNFGSLPETLAVIGDVCYDDGMAKYTSELTSEDTQLSSLIFVIYYRKRTIDPKNFQTRTNKPVRHIYLKHFDPNHTGPVTSISPPIKEVELSNGSKSCSASLSMLDIWKNDRSYISSPDNSKSFPPKSFIGFENFENGKGRFVLYERFGGDEWLSDIEEGKK